MSAESATHRDRVALARQCSRSQRRSPRSGLGAFGAEAAPAAPLISSAPLRPTVSTRATFAFDQLPGLTYECAVDDGVVCGVLEPDDVRRAEPVGSHVPRSRSQAGGCGEFRLGVLVDDRRTAAAGRGEQREPPTDVDDGPRAAVDLDERDVRVAADADDTRGVPSRRRPLAVLRRTEDVPRPRSRSTRLSVCVVGGRAGRRSSVNRFTWTITSSPRRVPPTISSQPDARRRRLMRHSTSPSPTVTLPSADSTAAHGWRARARRVRRPRVGSHLFCVRAVNGSGVIGPETCVAWTVLASPSAPEPSGPFTITGNLPNALSPGASQPLPLRISNPFDFALRVTSLTVTVRPGSSQAGCDGPSNLVITQSNTAGRIGLDRRACAELRHASRTGRNGSHGRDARPADESGRVQGRGLHRGLQRRGSAVRDALCADACSRLVRRGRGLRGCRHRRCLLECGVEPGRKRSCNRRRASHRGHAVRIARRSHRDGQLGAVERERLIARTAHVRRILGHALRGGRPRNADRAGRDVHGRPLRRRRIH